MASISSALMESTFRFTLNTKNLKKSKSVYTPEIRFSNVGWKIKFSRKTNGSDEEYLAIYLESAKLKKSSIFGKTTKEWTREAQATFKLLQTDGHTDKPFVKSVPSKTFETKHLSHGIDDFIKWNKFLKDYAHDSLATFELNISSSPLKLKRNTIEEIIPISTKMLVRINGVKQLGKIRSSRVVIQGIRWNVCVEKRDEHLAIYLSGDADDMDANWCYKVDVTFTLLTSNPDSKSCSCNLVGTFEKGSSNGLYQWLKWSDFVDESKGYIDGYTAKFNVEIKVDDPEPTWKMDYPTLLKSSSSFECIATPS